MKDNTLSQNTLSQIKRDPLVESVLKKITEAIVTSHLKPGDRLVETQLGEQLGVSRAPIREAFRRLEQMGLVEKIPYRGTFVSKLTQNDIEELHMVRERLESLAVRLLAQAQNPHAIIKLEAILNEFRLQDANAPSTITKLITIDANFHDALIALSGHKLLGDVWSVISIRLHRFLFLKRQRLFQTPLEAYQIHEPIVQAIILGDATQAEDAVRRHISEAPRSLYLEDLSEC